MKNYYIAIIIISIIIQFFSIYNENWSSTNVTIIDQSLTLNSSLYNMTTDSSSYNSFLLIIFGIILLFAGIIMLILNNNYAFAIIVVGSLFSILACILSIININKINNDINNAINSASMYSSEINLKNPFVPKPTVPTSVLKNIKQNNSISDNISSTLKPGYCLYLNLVSSLLTLFLQSNFSE